MKFTAVILIHHNTKRCSVRQASQQQSQNTHTHGVATKSMYDSVPQQISEDDCCNGNTDGFTVIDNTALYSAACEDGEYSKLSQK